MHKATRPQFGAAPGGSAAGPEPRPRHGGLTPREREVVALLAEGLTGEEIAERLYVSPETVRTHVRNAMEKLEANTRVHAVAIALRQGEI